jgi:hypothetical protein
LYDLLIETNSAYDVADINVLNAAMVT